MIRYVPLIFGFLFTCNLSGQSGQELINSLKNEYDGYTYYSDYSASIADVTFYQVDGDYETIYYAIVCFRRENSTYCDEYIYQVEYYTEDDYALDFEYSAGEAFWNHIEPFSDVLDCGPGF
jgi:hypothetical protein